MAKGLSVESMSIRNENDRRKIIFIFTGNGELRQMSRAFQDGKALVNPIELKKSILHLKDMMAGDNSLHKFDRLQNERRLKDGTKQNYPRRD
jgi:hypothetical protein